MFPTLEKPMTRQEEAELFGHVKTDSEARDIAVMRNLRLVVCEIKKYNGHDPDDLFQAGAIGLIKAVDTFDVGRGFVFSTYAVRCIANEIKQYLRKVQRCAPALSLDTVITRDKDEYTYTIADTLKSEDEGFAATELISDIDRLDYIDKQCVSMYAYGMTQTEIGVILGISRVTVSRRMKKIRQKLSGYK